MNAKIANIIVDYIKELSWVDKVAGLVQTVRVSQQDGDRVVEKRYPVSCSAAYDDKCLEGCYDDLMPNSAYSSLIYFEDGSLTLTASSRNRRYYQSNIRLVCWLNYKKIVGGCGASGDYVIDIVKHLPAYPVNIGDMLGVNIEVTSQAQRSNAIFGNYTYNEKQTQYLMLPYDFFALEIKTTFFIINECVEIEGGGCLEC